MPINLIKLIIYSFVIKNIAKKTLLTYQFSILTLRIWFISLLLGHEFSVQWNEFPLPK